MVLDPLGKVQSGNKFRLHNFRNVVFAHLFANVSRILFPWRGNAMPSTSSLVPRSGTVSFVGGKNVGRGGHVPPYICMNVVYTIV